MTLQKISPPQALPTKKVIQRLHEEEFKDVAVNISFWQYVHVLCDPSITAALTPRVKSILKMLFFNSLPLTSTELATFLNEKHAVVVHGNAGLGGFAAEFWEQLQSEFSDLYPNPQQLEDAAHKWFSLVFCDFIQHDENGNDTIYYCLKSRFRAALAHCFEENEILSW